jgi:translation initiation factor 2 alpha subunit (eIF-2alpha)
MTTKYIYNKKFPDIDEIVLVKVTNISEYGVNVLLTEYGNIEGFINFTEVSC